MRKCLVPCETGEFTPEELIHEFDWKRFHQRGLAFAAVSKFPVVAIVMGRAVDGKLNDLEGTDVFPGKRKHHVCDYGRIIAEGPASECPQDKDIHLIPDCDIKNPRVAPFMQFPKFRITQYQAGLSVPRIVAVAQPFPEVRGGTGYDVHIISAVFRQSLRNPRIALENRYILRIDDVVIMQWIFCPAVRLVKAIPVFVRVQCEVQRRSAAQTFLLRPRTVHHTAARI